MTAYHLLRKKVPRHNATHL